MVYNKQPHPTIRRVISIDTMSQGVYEDKEIMNSYDQEQDKQKRMLVEIQSKGFTLADDPAGFNDLIGSVQSVTTWCEMWTPRLLCKLFVEGTTHVEHSFHLVPLHQIVKWLYEVPNPGETFTGQFIIGVRRVSNTQYVPALRLPRK